MRRDEAAVFALGLVLIVASRVALEVWLRAWPEDAVVSRAVHGDADPWGRPYLNQDGADCPNCRQPLYSAGPDGRDQCGEGDDVILPDDWRSFGAPVETGVALALRVGVSTVVAAGALRLLRSRLASGRAYEVIVLVGTGAAACGLAVWLLAAVPREVPASFAQAGLVAAGGASIYGSVGLSTLLFAWVVRSRERSSRIQALNAPE